MVIPAKLPLTTPLLRTHVMLVEVHEEERPLPLVTYIFYGKTKDEAEEAFSNHCAVDDLLAVAALEGQIGPNASARERGIAGRKVRMQAVLMDSAELAKRLGQRP